MSALFRFTPSTFTRVKRKMSGPGEEIIDFLERETSSSSSHTEDEDYNEAGADSDASSTTKANSDINSSINHQSNAWWFCELCKSIDIREVLGFIVWEILTVLIVVLAVADWIFFFKFVVEPDSPRVRMQWGALWAIFTVALLSFRSAVRAKCGTHVRALAEHAEIFVMTSLVMMFATNTAFYLHTPSAHPLTDLGFLLIPEQAVDSKWRPLSDVLTATMPVIFMVQTYFMTRENRCRVMSTFFRVATICYALRTLTVALTSLPGPAPHCRPGNPLYLPPQSWIDIVTRVGPMYGKFNSCGDLIFSGHMAYTNSAVLLYLRVLDQYFVRGSKLRWTIGISYLVILAGLCVSGRKHYSVDVMLGLMVSTLVYFHFEHGWVPLCLRQPHYLALQRRAGRIVAHPSGVVKPCNDDFHYVYAVDTYDQELGQYRVAKEQQSSSLVDYIC